MEEEEGMGDGGHDERRDKRHNSEGIREAKMEEDKGGERGGSEKKERHERRRISETYKWRKTRIKEEKDNRDARDMKNEGYQRSMDESEDGAVKKRKLQHRDTHNK